MSIRAGTDCYVEPGKVCLHFTELFSFYLQKKKEEGIIDSSDKEIVAEAERLDVKAMGPLVLTGVLFKEEIREHIRNTGTISYDFVTTTTKLNGTFFVV